MPEPTALQMKFSGVSMVRRFHWRVHLEVLPTLTLLRLRFSRTMKATLLAVTELRLARIRLIPEPCELLFEVLDRGFLALQQIGDEGLIWESRSRIVGFLIQTSNPCSAYFSCSVDEFGREDWVGRYKICTAGRRLSSKC